MKYLAAYLLLATGGNTSPSAEDIKSLLATVNIETEEERLNSLISELQGKDLATLIQEGSSKLASVPSGGAASSSAPAAAGGASAPAAAEEKKEEKVEDKEESDDDMGFGLFD